MYQLSALLTPSIESLGLEGLVAATSSDDRSAAALLNILRRNNYVALRKFFAGLFTSNILFQHIIYFPALPVLRLDARRASKGTLRKAPSQVDSLQRLEHLTSLDLDLNVFSRNGIQLLGSRLTELEKLSELTLHGTWNEIHRCAFSLRTYPHIHALTLFSSKYPLQNLFSLLSSTFPKLDSFHLEYTRNRPSELSWKYEIQDFTELKEHSMKSLSSAGSPLQISPADLATMLTAWPRLERIELLHAEASHFDAKLALSHGSTLGSRLHVLCLPLDLSSLTTPLPDPFAPSYSPLKKLHFNPQSVPESVQQKHALVLNILRLFPRVNVIARFTLDGEVTSDQNLQDILDLIREVMISLPSRPDHLFRT